MRQHLAYKHDENKIIVICFECRYDWEVSNIFKWYKCPRCNTQSTIKNIDLKPKWYD
jgi:hypothetical protein